MGRGLRDPRAPGSGRRRLLETLERERRDVQGPGIADWDCDWDWARAGGHPQRPQRGGRIECVNGCMEPYAFGFFFNHGLRPMAQRSGKFAPAEVTVGQGVIHRGQILETPSSRHPTPDPRDTFGHLGTDPRTGSSRKHRTAYLFLHRASCFAILRPFRKRGGRKHRTAYLFLARDHRARGSRTAVDYSYRKDVAPNIYD